jgi:(E)-4-hydroxy-3-methyl-but-2-enyl pyrophosphate reductase
MDVLLAEEMGMCFGVRDALAALDQIADPSRVTIHGQLVHNEVVLHQLGVRGFRMTAESDRDQVPETDAVLVTAHGISRRERDRLTAAGKRLIDTTCPLVRRAHDAAVRFRREGYHVILIGRPGHVEVRGIVEDLEHYAVVETAEDVRAYPSPRLAVLSQTTVAPRVVAEVHAAVVAANPAAEVRFADTTCQPTRNRQHAVERLIPRVQAVVVVGGRNSNNTRELVDLCRRHGLRTWQVRDAGDLRPDWFRGVDRVGLTAGTSTPDGTIRDVHDWLRHCRPAGDGDPAPARAGPVLPPVRTSAEWITYFGANAAGRRPVPWDQGPGVTPDELAAIAGSLRGWQLGETSDGAHLLAAARHYAAAVGDPAFVDAVRLFIAEEQRHGADLGRFLDLAGVGRATSDWGDTLFRAARYFVPRMEVWVTPVVMVETLALVYYNAIRRATGSPVLRRVCEQVLADEVPHIRFQCERLAVLHRDRPRALRAATMCAHRVLFTAITLAVWAGHRRAIRAGGYSFRRFWRAAWGKMEYVWRMTSPGRYSWTLDRPPV